MDWPRPYDCSADSSRPPFFSELIDQIGEGFFRPGIYDLAGRRVLAAIHAHIQGARGHQRKTALRFRQLKPAYSQIRNKSVNLLHSRGCQGGAQFRKPAVLKTDTVCQFRGIFPGCNQRLGIPVVRDHNTCCQAFGDRPRVASEPGSRIEICAVRQASPDNPAIPPA